MSKQKRNVEWSFDFEGMGERVGRFFSDMMGGGDEVELQRAELAAPLDGAESARIKVDFSVGKATVAALPAASENLFEAQIAYVGEYEFEISGAAERVVELRQKGRFPRGMGHLVGNAKELHWDIALAGGLPHQLSLKGGVGETDIDLSHLQVDALRLETGVGKIALTLPLQEADFDARISGGVGKTEVTIPGGAGGTLDIDGGVGEVTVTVSPAAALRVEGNSGLGPIHLPDALVRIEGSGSSVGASGVWETAGFADAEKRIVIDFDGGVGSFRLQFFELV